MHWQTRSATGTGASDQTVAHGTISGWLRLERRGDLTIASHSMNGGGWTLAGLANVKIVATVHIGIEVASGDEWTPNNSGFGSAEVVP